ncbi:MAG: GWxTD domain-containing protein [Reichenbachiella sp.]
MSLKFYALTSLFILCTVGQAISLDFSKVDFSYLYQKNGVKLSYQIAKIDSSYSVALFFSFQRITEDQKLERFELFSQDNFTSNKQLTLATSIQSIEKTAVGEYHYYEFYPSQTNQYVGIKTSLSNHPFVFFIPINEAIVYPPAKFLILPSNKNTSLITGSKGDSLSISNYQSGYSYYFVEFSNAFQVSQPPFVITPPKNSNKKLNVQKIHRSNDSSFVPTTNNTLYFVQTDTTTSLGQGITTYQSNFPKTKDITELIEPLIFLTTQEEAVQLANSEEKKKAFERFWLGNISSKEKAAQTIKTFYRRIKEANHYFTTYKSGWKTDMGMIYTIYGPPSHVAKSPSEEIWEYETYDGKIKFTFALQPNVFVNNHYVLNRDKKYTGIWFNQVKKWRSGDI